jgi:hypothetical protein
MTSTTTNNKDLEHPTQEPFTAPDESSNVNNCTCCGIFLVPLAALGGLIDQVLRKIERLFGKGEDKK